VTKRITIGLVQVLVLTAIGVGLLPAQTRAVGSWQNVEILGDATAQDMDLFMRAMSASLGVGCEYCHEGDAWHLEGRREKGIARSMMRMLADLSVTGFEALDLPSCWTCHRGSPVPATAPPAAGVEPLPTGQGPFRGEYENLQLTGVSRADLPSMMAGFVRDLGEDCEYCHVSGDWASDEKVSKPLARRMHEIQNGMDQRYFGSAGAISCWTCHRGERVPEIVLPGDLVAP
jgi:hypothetical protein